MSKYGHPSLSVIKSSIGGGEASANFEEFREFPILFAKLLTKSAEFFTQHNASALKLGAVRIILNPGGSIFWLLEVHYLGVGVTRISTRRPAPAFLDMREQQRDTTYKHVHKLNLLADVPVGSISLPPFVTATPPPPKKTHTPLIFSHA